MSQFFDDSIDSPRDLMTMPSPFPPEFFRRLDESEDEQFYSAPRMVVHIDDGAIRKVAEIYAQVLPQDGAVLDLMSSWRSHLPEHSRPSRVVGLGMNRDEMAENPALTDFIVHNLNRDPRTALNDAEFDGAIVTVSVQYMTRPIEIFREVGRVLKAGAVFAVTFSNRMFPNKAVAIWQSLDDDNRSRLVARYFMDAGCFENIEFIDRSRDDGDQSDPIWAVIGRRKRGETA